MPRVENSRSAPCWLQEQIARQNSYVDSVLGGKRVAYAAPCKAVPIPPAAPTPKQPAGQV